MTVYILVEYIRLFREDSLIDFVWRNAPATFFLDPTPSSRNVKFQTDPLIVVLIAVSRANRPRPKHAQRFILMNWAIRLNIITITHFSGVIMIFSHSFCLILGWRKSIISNLRETSSNKTLTPLNVSGTFLWPKSINEFSLNRMNQPHYFEGECLDIR